MNAQGTERTEKRLCVGLLAHVDAGKTTLSEAMLYRAGVIRTLGRVDHGDTFLDTDAQERSRGITIFSKQAVLPLPGCTLTLLDTIATDDHILEDIDLRMKVRQLYDAVKTRLSPREREIILLRYGLTGQRPLVQREVAKKLNISRSYVSRLEKKALQKLRKAFDE